MAWLNIGCCNRQKMFDITSCLLFHFIIYPMIFLFSNAAFMHCRSPECYMFWRFTSWPARSGLFRRCYSSNNNFQFCPFPNYIVFMWSLIAQLIPSIILFIAPCVVLSRFADLSWWKTLFPYSKMQVRKTFLYKLIGVFLFLSTGPNFPLTFSFLFRCTNKWISFRDTASVFPNFICRQTFFETV